MEIKEQLKEMFQMQITFNENVLKEFGKESATEEELELAIIDELGKLTHELKPNWCWWDEQPPVNRQKVLEKLVGVWCFVLTYELFSSEYSIDELIHYYDFYINRFGKGVQGDLNNYINGVSLEGDKLDCLLDLTEKLNFSMDEVYQEYLNKNKINWERLKNYE